MNNTKTEMKHHELKLGSKNFQAIVDSLKRSDVRKHDRDFQVGDSVTFKEGDVNEDGVFIYTGRDVSCQISFIDDFGCHDGYVNLSLVRVGLLVVS